MKDSIFIGLVGLLVILILAASVAWEYSVWEECRQTNSFLYCLRVLSK